MGRALRFQAGADVDRGLKPEASRLQPLNKSRAASLLPLIADR